MTSRSANSKGRREQHKNNNLPDKFSLPLSFRHNRFSIIILFSLHFLVLSFFFPVLYCFVAVPLQPASQQGFTLKNIASSLFCVPFPSIVNHSTHTYFSIQVLSVYCFPIPFSPLCYSLEGQFLLGFTFTF